MPPLMRAMSHRFGEIAYDLPVELAVPSGTVFFVTSAASQFPTYEKFAVDGQFFIA